MSKKSVLVVGTPPMIGMEIEANYPNFEHLPPSLQGIFRDAGGSGYNSAWAAFQQSSGPYPHRFGSHEQADVLQRLIAAMPEEWRYPIGWDKGSDSGVEMRFNGPAGSLAQAERLIKSAVAWLTKWNFTAFSGAGTHVHLGHVAWLQEVFGTDPIIRGRAEALMWAYFATRERAIFQIASPHRLTCGACTPAFVSRTQVNPLLRAGTPSGTILSSTTPLWVFHNHFVTNPQPDNYHSGIGSAGLQNRRKGLPTLEFRHFSGTNRETALVGYVRLLYNMFLRATTVLTYEACRASTEDQLSAPIVQNPWTFTINDLKKEISDPWLLQWIDKTVANKGEPINDEISDKVSIPQAVAAA